MMSKVVTIMLAVSTCLFAKTIDLKGKKIELKKTLILLDNSSIVGPGIVKIKSSSDGIVLNGTNILISNITFVVEDNPKRHNTLFKLTDKSSHIKIKDNHFLGARYSVLKADINSTMDKDLKFKRPAKHILFEGNLCDGMYSRHLYLSNVYDLKVINNTFKNSTRDSIRLRQLVKKVIISSNTFSNIGRISKESSDGIDSFWSGDELIITNNNFENIATHGLDIKGISPDSESKTSKVIISNNLFDNIQYSGVLISSGSWHKSKENVVKGFVISNNQFSNTNLNNKNPNDASIFIRHGVQNAIISSNIIDAQRSHGIVAANYTKKVAQTSNIVITSNIINSKFSPVVLNAVKNSLVSNNNMNEKKVLRVKKSGLYKESGYLESNNL